MGKKVSKNSCVWDNPNTWRVGPKFWKVSGVPRFVFGMAHVKRTLTQARFPEASADRKPGEVESVLALGNEMEGPRRTNARPEWDNGSEREGPDSGRMEGHATKCDGGPRKPREQQAQPALSSSTEPATPNRNNAHGTTTMIAETSDAAQSKAEPSGSQSGLPLLGPRHKDGVTGTTPNNKQDVYVWLGVCGGVWCVVLGPSARVAGARAKRGDVCDSRQRYPRRMRGAPAVVCTADQ